jgi:tRNA dimethylallyltransferase
VSVIADHLRISLPDGHRTLLLSGPTASGKTGLAIELALKHGRAEIINADSLLVYRGLDIGTAKPSLTERQGIPHHLIDILEPNVAFTAADFRTRARACIEDIHARGNRAIVVGGTGFYLKALLFGIWDAPKADPLLREELVHLENEKLVEELRARDPEAATRIGVNDRYRLIRAVEILRLSGKSPTELERAQNLLPDPALELRILDRADTELGSRIRARTSQMIRDGIIEEYQRVRAAFGEVRPLAAVGYREVGRYLSGEAPAGRKLRPGLPGLEDEINLATRQLVKSQRTFFKNLEKRTCQSGGSSN